MITFPAFGDQVRIYRNNVEICSTATYGLSTRNLYAYIFAYTDTSTNQNEVFFDTFQLGATGVGIVTEPGCYMRSGYFSGQYIR